ncbi:MAG: AraC family transcriptional regulator [Hyphomicrobiales bacterium]
MAPRFELRQKSDDTFLVDNSPNNSFIELVETSFAKLTCGPRRFLPKPHIVSAHFTHSAPTYADAYNHIFQCPVHFNSHWNALQLAPNIADWPVAQYPRYIFSNLTAHADTLLSIANAETSITSQLSAKLLPFLHLGETSSKNIAQKLGISRTTLYRKLKSEGTSYAKTRDTLRHHLAIQYLKGQKASINEVAYLVGFSEPAAFSRAFKRWTGQNPQEFKSNS